MGLIVPEICPESGGNKKNKTIVVFSHFGRVHFATIGGKMYQQINCPWPMQITQEITSYMYTELKVVCTGKNYYKWLLPFD